jgi:hypothetical protein
MSMSVKKAIDTVEFLTMVRCNPDSMPSIRLARTDDEHDRTLTAIQVLLAEAKVHLGENT